MTVRSNARLPAAPHEAGSAEVHTPSFGSNARALRLQRGLTLDRLAAETGLSKGHLSRFERGEKTLSIAALMRVSQALGTSVAALLGDGVREGPLHLVRAGQGTVRAVPADDGSYTYTALSRAGDNGLLSAFLVAMAADATRTGEVAHGGEEALFVLSGRVEVDVAGDRVVLGAGDYLQFSGAVRHHILSLEGESRIIIVVARG